MIDENEAPEGYKAVHRERSIGCNGCVFLEAVGVEDLCVEVDCMSKWRKDGASVVFKKKSKDEK